MVSKRRTGWLMNTVVPDAWIIQEKIQREKERQRKEDEDNSLPISLPDVDEELFDLEKSPRESTTKSTVIVIDI